MYHEQLVKHNNLNTKMNLHNDDDNVNDDDIHVIIIMLAYNFHTHIMAVLYNIIILANCWSHDRRSMSNVSMSVHK